MRPVELVLNILWVLFGGWWMAVGWWLAGILLALTIIGLPFARDAFEMARYSLLPFGSKAVSRRAYEGRGGGPLTTLANILWLVLAGWWLAFGHLGTAAVLAATLIGIPFAWAHVKLAMLALWPGGKIIVPSDALPPGALRWR